MTATSVVCPECGSPVAPGRLSCQSCGTLLASVVGSDRRRPWSATSASLPEIDEDSPLASSLLLEPAPAPMVAEIVEPAPAPKRGPRRLTRPKPATNPAPAKARYVKSPPDDAPPPLDPTSLFGPVPTVAPPILHDWSDETNGSVASEAATAAALVPSATPSATATVARPATREQRPKAPPREPRPAGAPPVPGSYLAPSATYVAPVASRSAPMAAVAPAATAWPTSRRFEAPAVAPNGNGTYGSAVPVAAPAAPAASAAATARGLSDWLTLGGSVLVIISFLLPWATDGVIGSRGTGFTADWGLANPGHLILIAAAIAVLLLQAVANPVPVWVRSAALPLLVGGILTGLAFAYYARPAGGGSGVAVLLAGALVLIAGGILASRPQRNGTSASSV